MVKYNLTDTQKDLIKELVSLIQSGSVDEEFQILWNGNNTVGYSAMLLSPKKPGTMLSNATKSGIDALARDDLLLYHEGSKLPTYTLTGKAYTAVETDFNSPDTSFEDEEFEAIADCLADEFELYVGVTVPALSDYAISRAGIYEEHP